MLGIFVVRIAYIIDNSYETWHCNLVLNILLMATFLLLDSIPLLVKLHGKDKTKLLKKNIGIVGSGMASIYHSYIVKLKPTHRRPCQ